MLVRYTKDGVRAIARRVLSKCAYVTEFRSGFPPSRGVICKWNFTVASFQRDRVIDTSSKIKFRGTKNFFDRDCLLIIIYIQYYYYIFLYIIVYGNIVYIIKILLYIIIYKNI